MIFLKKEVEGKISQKSREIEGIKRELSETENEVRKKENELKALQKSFDSTVSEIQLEYKFIETREQALKTHQNQNQATNSLSNQNPISIPRYSQN